MNLETTLFYVTHHSESIIQWLFLTILLLVGVVISRAIFGKKDGASAASAGKAADGDIHQFLERILDQTKKLEGISLEGVGPKVAADVEAQVQNLKKDLASREEELNKLKAAGDGKPSAESEKLSGRIKELEAKLAEYEILEDDIADLSLYKEENVRLRGEIEKIRGGGGAAVGAAPSGPTVASTEPVAAASSSPPPDNAAPIDMSTVAAPAAVATPPTSEDIVAEFAEAVGQDVAPAQGEKPTLELVETGDPMVDFEAAVKLEKKLMGTETAPAKPAAAAKPAAVPTPAPAVAAAPSAPPEAVAEGDDLFAEFAEAAKEPEPAPAAVASEDGSLDTEKMMAEMAALVSMEPSTDNSLEEDIDTDKMAMEATGLTKAQ